MAKKRFTRKFRVQSESGVEFVDPRNTYGANIGDFNPFVQPRKRGGENNPASPRERKVRKIFDDNGILYYSDVLADPELWMNPRKRKSRFLRASRYSDLDQAIISYFEDDPHLIPFVTFFRDSRGYWRPYITITSDGE